MEACPFQTPWKGKTEPHYTRQTQSWKVSLIRFILVPENMVPAELLHAFP